MTRHELIVGAGLVAMGALVVAWVAWPRARRVLGPLTAGFLGALAALLWRARDPLAPAADPEGEDDPSGEGAGLDEATDPRTPPPILPTDYYSEAYDDRDDDDDDDAPADGAAGDPVRDDTTPPPGPGYGLWVEYSREDPD